MKKESIYPTPTPDELPYGKAFLVEQEHSQEGQLERAKEYARQAHDVVGQLESEFAAQRLSPLEKAAALDAAGADIFEQSTNHTTLEASSQAVAMGVEIVGQDGNQPRTSEHLLTQSHEKVILALDAKVALGEIVRAEHVARELQCYMKERALNEQREQKRQTYQEAMQSGRLQSEQVSEERERQLQDSPYLQSRQEFSDMRYADGAVFNALGMDPEKREAYRADLLNRFMMPNEQRSGTELLDEQGNERLPIMDITLERNEQENVARAVSQRSQAYRQAHERLAAIAASQESLSQDDIMRLLQEEGVLQEQYGHGVNPEGKTEAGTAADLYLDAGDVALAQQIDQLAQQLSGATQGVYDRIQARTATFLANMIPAGTELLHTTSTNGLEGIVAQGGLGPRSQFLHGTQAEAKIQGGLVHFTGFGTYASGYGQHTIGIPIDTIIEKTPYLQPEKTFQGNDGDRDGLYSQEKMGGIVINDVSSLPALLRDRLEAVHDTIDTHGLQGVTVNGDFDNFAFAASSDKEAASQYEYSLDDMTIYTPGEQGSDGTKAAISAITENESAQLRAIYGRANAGEGSTVNGASTPNFSLADGMKVYGSLYATKTTYHEGAEMAGRREINLTSVVEGAIHRHVGELLAVSNEDPREVMNEAFLEIAKAEQAATSEYEAEKTVADMQKSIVYSYINSYEDIDHRKITPKEVFAPIEPEHVVSGATTGVYRADALSSKDKSELLGAIVEKATQGNDPDWWSEQSIDAHARSAVEVNGHLKQLGFEPSDEQLRAAEYRLQQKRQADEGRRVEPMSLELPMFDGGLL